ncbi:MAG: phosphopantothenoylcysteine decarboxylase / phosphopantothenate---cysteine ligase [Solirubrobacteraceae bacterium]|jgi:phosphopantothenoylcysteine decarboxylase/phosphopantothenate--cysteine ligase|nr:phosphopantothenoylcysteine decarboxylase / phosphopantothenate---cysteine ligase [Solirubrobacteraceae bacterium]
MARLLLGVSGGIAAYKALEATRLAIKAGHAVRVIQTETSLRFIGPDSFAGITGAPVLCRDSDPDPLRGSFPGDPAPPRVPISHLALAENADVFLIAPASANTIAKLAHGHADSLLCAAALAAPGPLLIAPAMNNRMYLHPATQANLELLAARGATVIAPGSGELASFGEYGVGRMAEPAELLVACERALATPAAGLADPGARSWRGRRVLITAGGTREPIDSVRFIGNRSSGRMGLALAEQALGRGAEVTLVVANVTLPVPAGVRVIAVQTAAELAAACHEEFAACDVLLMAAAVADFRPRAAASTKLKKHHGAPQIELEATEDVISALADERHPDQILIGFAAEHGAGAVDYGRDKLERKRLDAVVVNDIADTSIGFDAAENEVTIVSAGGADRHVAKVGKAEVAAAVLDEVDLLIQRGRDHRAVRADSDRAASV